MSKRSKKQFGTCKKWHEIWGSVADIENIFICNSCLDMYIFFCSSRGVENKTAKEPCFRLIKQLYAVYSSSYSFWLEVLLSLFMKQVFFDSRVSVSSIIIIHTFICIFLWFNHPPNSHQWNRYSSASFSNIISVTQHISCHNNIHLFTDVFFVMGSVVYLVQSNTGKYLTIGTSPNCTKPLFVHMY